MTDQYSVVDYIRVNDSPTYRFVRNFNHAGEAAKFADEYAHLIVENEHPRHILLPVRDLSTDMYINDHEDYGSPMIGYSLHQTFPIIRRVIVYRKGVNEMKDDTVKPELKVRWIAKNLSNTEKTFHDTKDEAMTEALGWLFSYQYAIGDAQPEARMYTIDEISIIELRWPDEPDEDIMSYQIYSEPIPMYRVSRTIEGLGEEILLTTEHYDKAIEAAEQYVASTISTARSYSLVYTDQSSETDTSYYCYMRWKFEYINRRNSNMPPPTYHITIIK